MHYTALFVALFANALGALSQTASGSWQCVSTPGPTDLPACDDLYTNWQICNGTATDQEYRECLCKQSFVNDMVNCESEARLCYESDSYDSEILTYLTNWHDVCDSFITFTPTSPVLSTLTTTFVLAAPSNQAYCNGIAADACLGLSQSVAACLQINTAATGVQFTSCVCQTPVLSLASVCLYDAAITCFSKTTAVLSDLPLYASCGEFYSSGAVITRGAGQQPQTSANNSPTPSATITVASSSSGPAQPSTAASNALVTTTTAVSSDATSSSTSIFATSTNSQGLTVSQSSMGSQAMALRIESGKNTVAIGITLWVLGLFWRR